MAKTKKARIISPAAQSAKAASALMRTIEMKRIINQSLHEQSEPDSILSAWEDAIGEVRLEYESKVSLSTLLESVPPELGPLAATLSYSEKTNNQDAYPRYKSFSFTLGPINDGEVLCFSSHWDENGHGQLGVDSSSGEFRTTELFDGSFFSLFREEKADRGKPKKKVAAANVVVVDKKEKKDQPSRGGSSKCEEVKSRWRAMMSRLGLEPSLPLPLLVKLMSHICDEDFESDSSLWHESE